LLSSVGDERPLIECGRPPFRGDGIANVSKDVGDDQR